MGHPSDARFLVLHALRLRGFADIEPVVATTGLAEPDVTGLLEQLGVEGLVHLREGRVHGWSLTASGREQHVKAVDGELDDAAARSAIETNYRWFLRLNREMLAVCTDWQLRDGALNEHGDAAYDKTVVDRLRSLDDRVQPICAALTEVLDRFGRYGARLANAVDKVEAGETEWFTKPLIDSYHTVWFELHEDLLATLGIERSKEEA
ncbi:MAG: hypothetical protein QOG03_53 [Actinomycetota bacterium]|nr:hypothetical protein [Actinomycetota bacterium]